MTVSTSETNSNETIAALASAPGPAERGIIRVSGPATVDTVRSILTGSVPDFHPTQSRRYHCQLSIADGQLELPADIYLWPTHRSFSGEPLAEIHCIGSPPLLNELLEKLLTSGARPAERGEFTLRAFLAGRIDLLQAEAVLGVVDAAEEKQLKSALDQLAGGISSQIDTIREELLIHLADLEAGLDFVEEDIDFVQRPEFLARLQQAQHYLEALLQQSTDRMQSTSRYRVVLAGLPNAGKSTLFNALVHAEKALVSHVAGTTRDYLEAAVEDESGLIFDLIDTAGWETARDGIEEIAGDFRLDQYQRADLVIWCQPADLDARSESVNKTLQQQIHAQCGEVLDVLTKSDMPTSLQTSAGIPVSATTGTGMQDLRNAILSKLSSNQGDSELIGATAARCRESLQNARDSVARANELVDLAAGDELVAMELRDVLDHLGRIVGKVYTDDILDRIFSRFCIGK